MDINIEEPIGKYFQLRDLIYSDKAKKLNINNMPGVDGNQSQIIESLRALMTNVVDIIGNTHSDLIISSAFRCKALNAEVGGADKSQHVWGEAVDLQVPSLTSAQLYNWIYNHTPFDHLIWEYPEDKTGSWVHVSYSMFRNPQRRRTSLASLASAHHNVYGGVRRGDKDRYQDGIELAKIV